MENLSQIIAVAVFIVTFFFIISEKIHRTVAALAGALSLIIVKVIDQSDAISFIDYTTIGLLIGMMIIISVLKRTGLFQYLAIISAKMAKGDPMKLIIIFGVVTAVLSAFLDNVTTVLLMVPVTIAISKMLSINPLPFVMSEIICSNIGGTATLVGDPPNIMIGSAVGIDFMSFVVNLGPVVLIILPLTAIILRFIYKKDLIVDESVKMQVFTLDEKSAIVDPKLLKQSLFILALVVIGFFIHGKLGYESSVIALGGAVLLLLFSSNDIEDILVEVEWPTIFFFAGLFIIVGTLQEVGVIPMLGKGLLDLTGGDVRTTGLVVLWSSAVLSAFLDNIPFVATMIPLIQTMGASGMDIGPIWWALALGACLGGNGSLVGASANLIVAGMLEKEAPEHRITFIGFLKVGFPLMILSIAISTVYMLVRYL